MSKFDVDAELVRKLAKLLKETGLTEIEFESDEKRIRVSAGAPTMAAAASVPASAGPVGPAGAPEAPVADAVGTVTSPMVGTAYLAPEPNAAPFVKVGDRVAKGQTLLVIEAMKVMNPIPAPESGVVLRVLASDGQPVEFGEPLMVIQ